MLRRWGSVLRVCLVGVCLEGGGSAFRGWRGVLGVCLEGGGVYLECV